VTVNELISEFEHIHTFPAPLDMEKRFSVRRQSVYMCVCMYGWMDWPLPNTLTVRLILFEFCIQEFIHVTSEPTEYEYSSPKIMGPSNVLENLEWRFSQKRL
jgi:hypothetical protein